MVIEDLETDVIIQYSVRCSLYLIIQDPEEPLRYEDPNKDMLFENTKVRVKQFLALAYYYELKPQSEVKDQTLVLE